MNRKVVKISLVRITFIAQNVPVKKNKKTTALRKKFQKYATLFGKEVEIKVVMKKVNNTYMKNVLKINQIKIKLRSIF